ncbi:MAG TPA: hypothetical protein DCP64_10670 [Sarcina sp.]|nr:hypothetical protein [Sarcina sp.]
MCGDSIDSGERRSCAADPHRMDNFVEAMDSGERRSCAVDPHRMDVFVEAMTPPGPAHLRSLEKQALDEGVPVIRPQTQNLIRFFLTLNRPGRILEIGTGVGFSALFMQYYAPLDCRITTIEIDPVRAEKARNNFVRDDYARDNYARGNGTRDNCTRDNYARDAFNSTSGIIQEKRRPLGHSLAEPIMDTAGPHPGAHGGAGTIELLEGDAADILPRIHEDASFDLIFMDAAKGQYIRLLPEVLRLLAEGGLLITDNILQEGDVLSSRFAVTRRNRTIHHRMRAYIRALMEAPELETLLVPSGDGAAVCVKRQNGLCRKTAGNEYQ